MRRLMNKIKTLMCDVEWYVAIREHVDYPIEEQENMEFQVLNNTWRYWCADPFVIEIDGITYLFMEVYDKITQRGFIGYRIYKSGKVSKIYKCMKLKYHLSYPYIYADGKDIYMIPECYQSNQLGVYHAVDFPNKWEIADVWLQNIAVCDTNLFVKENEKYLMTMELTEIPFQYDELSLYYSENGSWKVSEANPIIKDASHARNAGAIFVDNGRLVRPAQNCSESYGKSLSFWEINTISKEEYRENLICQIGVDQVNTTNSNICFDGIHTYNTNGKYDVIDLRRESSFQWVRIMYLIKCRLERILKRK